MLYDFGVITSGRLVDVTPGCVDPRIPRPRLSLAPHFLVHAFFPGDMGRSRRGKLHRHPRKRGRPLADDNERPVTLQPRDVVDIADAVGEGATRVLDTLIMARGFGL